MKRFVKSLFLITLGLCFTIVLFFIILYWSRDSRDLGFLPSDDEMLNARDSLTSKGVLTLGEEGCWNLYAQGAPVVIGNVMGKFGQDLVRYQEKVFVDAIRRVVPSDTYLAFLRVLLGAYNRNLASSVPDEYKQEIYAMAQYGSDEYNIIGSPYDRQLNYHAAHDIGHAMQRYMLVGCTSFGVWGSRSKEGKLLVGRNFDFYFGDEFARNKLISVINPQQGYAFIAVGWPGMVGVLSGMNEKGLTVTINAAQGEIPLSSATPVSILARKILQYASNIAEAVAIAREYELFTSEQFLIGSASDGCCATIEKTHAKMDVVYGTEGMIVNANHYRGEVFANDKWNNENILMSDSKYRYRRVEELIDSIHSLDVCDVVSILRNRKGIAGKEIGFTNQKSINQMIANHSVVFEPQGRNIWVAAGKGWPCGRYVHYNLDTLLARAAIGVNNSLFDAFEGKCDIGEDTLFMNHDYARVVEFRSMMAQFENGSGPLDIERFISLNPNYYRTWEVLAEHYIEKGNYAEAVKCYTKALDCEVATLWERDAIGDRLEELKGKN